MFLDLSANSNQNCTRTALVKCLYIRYNKIRSSLHSSIVPSACNVSLSWPGLSVEFMTPYIVSLVQNFYAPFYTRSSFVTSEMCSVLSLLADVKSISVGISLSPLWQGNLFFNSWSGSYWGVTRQCWCNSGTFALIWLKKKKAASPLRCLQDFANCSVADTFSF